jgi:hypothetical protein
MGFSSPLGNRSFDTMIGDKIYMLWAWTGATGTGNYTSLSVINTRTGAVSRITGLDSGNYSGCYRVGTKLYIFRGRHIGTIPSYNRVYRINTVDDTYVAITLGASRPYVFAELVGNRLYFGWEGTTVATDIPFINTTDDTPGMTTGLVSRTQHGFFVADNKLFVAGNAASTSINVITGTGGTAPNYTTWTVSNIASLPNREYSNNWSKAAAWCRAGDFLYVGAHDKGTSILRIQHKTAANTTTELTGLPDVEQRPMELVGTKIYVGSQTAGTTMTVITNANAATAATKQITGLPSRAYNAMQRVGTKIYVANRTSAANIIAINSADDSFVTVLNSSTGVSAFVVDDATGNLYCFDTWSTTSGAVINTKDDTLRARVSWPNGSYNVLVEVPISRANPEGGVYVGGSGTFILEIDFASVNERPSGATWPARQITGLPSRSHSSAFFANEKIWLGDRSDNRTNIVCLTKSVLPDHPSTGTTANTAPFVYVRY